MSPPSHRRRGRDNLRREGQRISVCPPTLEDLCFGMPSSVVGVRDDGESGRDQLAVAGAVLCAFGMEAGIGLVALSRRGIRRLCCCRVSFATVNKRLSIVRARGQAR